MFISIDTMLTTPLLMPPEHQDVCSRMHCCLQPDVARAKLAPVPPPSDEPVPEPAGYEAKFPNDYENYDPAVSVRLLRLASRSAASTCMHACTPSVHLDCWACLFLVQLADQPCLVPDEICRQAVCSWLLTQACCRAAAEWPAAAEGALGAGPLAPRGAALQAC
jgi:hypothetical protein